MSQTEPAEQNGPTERKNQVAEPLLPEAWEVPQAFRDRLGEEAGRQRVMEAEGQLLVVLHAPPTPGKHIRFGKTYWRNAEGAWKPVAQDHTSNPIGELLDQYNEVLDSIQQIVDDADRAREYFDVLSALVPLVRACKNLHEVLTETRNIARDDRALILLRDRSYTLSRRAELLQHDAKNMLDFVIARRAEVQAEEAQRQTKAAYRLNVIVALFFPVATAASVLGIELTNGLEGLDNLYPGLPIYSVVGVGLLLGIILAVFVTRK